MKFDRISAPKTRTSFRVATDELGTRTSAGPSLSMLETRGSGGPLDEYSRVLPWSAVNLGQNL